MNKDRLKGGFLTLAHSNWIGRLSWCHLYWIILNLRNVQVSEFCMIVAKVIVKSDTSVDGSEFSPEGNV